MEKVIGERSREKVVVTREIADAIAEDEGGWRERRRKERRGII